MEVMLLNVLCPAAVPVVHSLRDLLCPPGKVPQAPHTSCFSAEGGR